MLLNSVILILQETLEAALMVSVLLAIASLFPLRPIWLAYGLTLGVIGACLYALNIQQISEWFEYVGQEVVNALLHTAIVLLITTYTALLFGVRIATATRLNAMSQTRSNTLFTGSAIAIVALGFIREGSEILLYLSGFAPNNTELPAVTIGSGIGFGIGLSIGTILYYVLVSLPNRWTLNISVMLLALFAGNMAAQSTLQLTQADWVPSTAVQWNTSAWISERSVTGHLLYALFGYEATPSTAQVIAYLLGIALVVVAAALSRLHRSSTISPGTSKK